MNVTHSIRGRAEKLNGYEYEHYVASLLSIDGWEAKVTSGSGDQGVDIIVSKNGTKIAVQCKKYSSPVGNKSVQEVNAGRGIFECDYGFVITNNLYTRSAKEAANKLEIFLLHHDDIPTILSFLNETKSQNSSDVFYAYNN